MKSPVNTTLLSLLASTALLAAPTLAQEGQGSSQAGGQIGADIQVEQPAPQITVQQPAPTVTVTQPQPQVTIEQPKPQVTVDQAEPDVTVQQQGEPNVKVQQPGDQAQKDSTTQQPATQDQQAVGTDTAGDATSAEDNPLYAMRGNQIVGKSVYGANGHEIGEVDNVVLSRTGSRSPAVVVGVGGFLGIGERNVAIPLDRLNMGNDNRLVTEMTRDQISGMQAYDQNDWDAWDANRPINEASRT